jgi:hypothetical protein
MSKVNLKNKRVLPEEKQMTYLATRKMRHKCHLIFMQFFFLLLD